MTWVLDQPLLRAAFARSFGNVQLADRFVDYIDVLSSGEGAIQAASFLTDAGDADIEIGSTGSVASVVLDSASTTHGVAFFVTSTLTSLNMTGTTGNVYINVTDNLADAFSIRIASGNRFLTFDSTNSNEKVIIAPVAGQKVGFFGATPVVQAATIADPSGGATQDAEARAAINAILVVLENLGFTATS